MKKFTTISACVSALVSLLSACSTEQLSTNHAQPQTVSVPQPMTGEARTSEKESKLAALSHEERVTLAMALINTHDWGTWEQHGKLNATFGDEELGNPLVNEYIAGKLVQPADALRPRLKKNPLNLRWRQVQHPRQLTLHAVVHLYSLAPY